MTPELFKMIANYGIMVVISGIFVWQQQVLFNKVFEILEKVTSTISKIENKLNNSDKLTGKGLELALTLKMQDIRWGLQKRIVKYILENNLKENWEIISREIAVLFEEKKQTYYITFKEIADNVMLKHVTDIINNELDDTHNIIISLMTDLKEKGSEEKKLYEVAQRGVENHFEHFENILTEKISKLAVWLPPFFIFKLKNINLLLIKGKNKTDALLRLLGYEE